MENQDNNRTGGIGGNNETGGIGGNNETGKCGDTGGEIRAEYYVPNVRSLFPEYIKTLWASCSRLAALAVSVLPAELTTSATQREQGRKERLEHARLCVQKELNEGPDSGCASLLICAATDGNLALLQIYREAGASHGWAWVCEAAAAHGHTHVLEWAAANHAPWPPGTLRNAVHGGDLRVLQWARDNGFPLDEDICSVAAGFDHLHILEWLFADRKLRVLFDAHTVARAAASGNTRILEWLQKKGVPRDEDAFFLAARAGQISSLRWLYAHNAPMDGPECCAVAAKHGQLEALQCLRDECGADWDHHTLVNAKIQNNDAVYAWAVANDAPERPPAARVVWELHRDYKQTPPRRARLIASAVSAVSAVRPTPATLST